MNEEEKKARAFLRFYVSDIKDEYFDRDYHIDKNFAETILNLIDKQQKEIDKCEYYQDHADLFLEENKKLKKEIAELKMEKQIISDMNLTVRRSEEVFNDIYIRKDKIVEKIEEITSYAYTSAEERDCQDYAIQVLKELLGE